METDNAPPALGEIARRQWGVVTREQLVELGFGTRGISDWARAGRLLRLYRGIYAVGHDRLRVEGRWLAAVLACGPGAVLSHRDAAHLWELRQSNSGLIDVTVPSRNGRVKRRGLRVHRSGRIGEWEVTERGGIPVTTVARTLLDLADVLPKQALRRAVTEAEYRDRLDITSINAVVQNDPGRRGAKLLEAVMGKAHRTRSPLGLVVELDGLSAHATREAVGRDRERDRKLWRSGLRTMRLTSEALDDEAAVIADLAQAGVSVASRSRASA
jgi:hypothetical protein